MARWMGLRAVLVLLVGLLCFCIPSAAQHGGGGGHGGGGNINPNPGACGISVQVTPVNPTVCVGKPQTFSAQVTVTSGYAHVVSYNWYVDGTQVPDASNWQATYTATWPAAGSHTVCCTVTAWCLLPNNPNCMFEWWLCPTSIQTATDCTTATVSANCGQCNIQVSLNPATVTLCLNQSQTFQASYSDLGGSGGTPTFQWTIDGATQPATGSSLTTSFTTTGTHTVCCLIADSCGAAQACSQVTVNSCNGCDVQAWISPPSVTLCLNQAQIFSVGYSATNGGQAAYQWAVDGVNAGTASTQAASFGTLGTHTVTCTVTVAGCGAQTAIATVNVVNCGTCTLDAHISPASPTLCKGTPQTFTAYTVITGGPAGGTSYQWYVDNAPAGTGQSLTTTFGTAGAHTVACQVTVDGCGTVTPTTSVTVNVCLRTRPQPGLPIGDNRPYLPMSCSMPSGGACMPSMNLILKAADPVPTRGFPLAVDIAVNSQIVETGRPMGAASFTYDLHIATDPVYDNNCNGVSHWMVVDANGTRLDFGPAGAAPAATPGIFSHLTHNQDGTYMLTGAGGPDALAQAGNFSYLFDAQGRLVQLTDDAGNTQTVNWSGNQMTNVTDLGTGKQITFQYSGSTIVGVTENGQQTTGISYNGLAVSQIRQKDANGAVLTTVDYAYNGDYTVSSITRDGDPNTTLNFLYIAAPDLSCTGTVPLLSQEFDSLGRVIFNLTQPPMNGADASFYVTNNKGGTTRYDFKLQAGQVINPDLTAVTLPQLVGATQPLVYTFQYDANHDCTLVSDGTRSATFGYASNGMLTSFHNSLGQAWTWSFAGTNASDLTGATDPAGTLGSATYPQTGLTHLPTTVTDAEAHAWGLAYNQFGQVTQVTPPTGSPLGPSNFSYDETYGSATLGWLKQVTDGNANKVTVDAYDVLGDPLQISTYPAQNVQHSTQFSWDGAQRLRQVTLPDNHTVAWNYTGSLLTSTQDEKGTLYNYGYCGPCGALTSVAGPLSWGLNWTLDGDRDLTAFTDARGKSTSYSYGLAGELSGVTYPDNSTLTYRYDNLGRTSKVTNGRNHDILLGWDNADRLTGVTFPTSGQPAISYAYNPDNTLLSVTDAAGTTSFTYTPNGNVQTVTYNYAASGLNALQVLTYAYNPDGSRHSLTWTNGGVTAATWVYSYDLGGRLTEVDATFPAAVGTEHTAWTYDGEDKLLSQLNANGTSTAWSYNELRGWPASITHYQGNSPFASYALTYDNGLNTVGNLTHVAESFPGGGNTADYSYDALYRLTGEWRNGSQTHAYGYDLAGNISTYDTTTYTLDNANKWLTSSAGGNALYDNDGNLTNQGFHNFNGPQYQWDDLSRLTAYKDNTNVQWINYGYDGLGRRVFRSVPGQTGNIPTWYVFDGDLLIGEVGTPFAVGGGGGVGGGGLEVLELAGPYVPQQGAAVAQMAYTWGAAGLVSSRSLPNNVEGGSNWYHFGPQGETRYLSGAAGAPVAYTQYSGYGIASGGLAANSGFNFGGQFGYYTDYAGILCGARWYDPAQGRWLSRDPISYDGGDNLYAYCGGDPVEGSDPDGLAVGHHYFPREIWNKLDLPDVVKDIFDRATTGPIPGSADLNVNDVTHRAYTAIVRTMWNKWSNGKALLQMTPAEAEEFVRMIKNSNNPAVKFFLAAIARRFADSARQMCDAGEAKAAQPIIRKVVDMVGERAGRSILRKAFKKVPMVNIAFFVYDWRTSGFKQAANNALWPLSELWGGSAPRKRYIRVR